MTKTRDLADLGGGFIQAGSGAEQRTVESKLQDVVSVKDFGVSGSGNETTLIRAAITACAGKTLHFPSGTYTVDSVLSFPNNINIIGDGSSTVIKQSDGQASNLFYIGTGVSYVSVSNLTLDGNWTNCTSTESANAVRVDDSQNIQLKNLVVKNISNDGITLKTAGISSANENILIEGCSFVNIGRNGVSVLSGKNIRVLSNNFSQCGYANIDVEPNTPNDCSHVSIIGNTGNTALLGNVWNHYSNSNVIVGNIYNNTKTKITGTQQASPTATTGNITLTDSTKNFISLGVSVGDAVASTVDANTGFKVVSVDSATQLTIRRVYGTATALQNGDTYTFYGERSGYGDWNSSDSLFTGNIANGIKTLGGTLTDQGGHGLVIEGCARGAYSDNVLTAADKGLWLSSSTTSSITGNYIKSTGGYALYSNNESSTNCVIKGNKLEGSSGLSYGLGVTHAIDGFNNDAYVRLYLSADQSIPVLADYTKVQFNVASGTASTSVYSTTTYKYTPTQAGIYLVLFRATAEFLTNDKFWRSAVFKNGTMVDYSNNYAAKSGQISDMMHSTVYLNGTTDYLEFYVRHDDTSAVSLDGSSIHTSATIIRLTNN